MPEAEDMAAKAVMEVVMVARAAMEELLAASTEGMQVVLAARVEVQCCVSVEHCKRE